MAAQEYYPAGADLGDPETAALEAEQRLFECYGLRPNTHVIELREPHIRVRVLDVGSGEATLVVPGGSGEVLSYAPLLAEITKRRFICINRPGAGLSDFIDPRQVDYRRLAVSVLSTTLDTLGLQSVPVIGNSMGGLWSLWFALDQPKRVTRLVEIGCPALILGTSMPLSMRLMAAPVAGNALGSFLVPKSPENAINGLKLMGSSPEQIRALPGAFAEALFRMGQLPGYKHTWMTLINALVTLRGARSEWQLGESELKEVRQPVLFIWGERDPFGALKVARRAASLVPNAELHVLHAGHLPLIDDPAACGKLIGAFL